VPAASNRKTVNRSTSRGRESTQSARRSSSARSSSARSSSQRRNAQSKSANGAQAKGNNAARAKSSNASRARARNGAQSKANGARSQQNDQQQEHIGREALTAVIGATVGVAGGVLLGRTALSRDRKVLGVPLPKKIDLTGVGQQIGEAGRQFGRLAGEVRGVREKAEQIGRVLR
jgi:hypothetical protein